MEPLFTQRTAGCASILTCPARAHPSVDRLATHNQMLDAVLAFIDTVILVNASCSLATPMGVHGPWRGLPQGSVDRWRDALCAPVKADLSQAHLPPGPRLWKTQRWWPS